MQTEDLVWKSQSLSGLGSFLSIKKTVNEGRGKYILFLSLFLTVHINFQYKLKYHTSLFVAAFGLFPSIALLIFFICNFTVFFPLIFDYKFNEYLLSLANEFSHSLYLILCLISIQERAKINFKNKQAKTFSI